MRISREVIRRAVDEEADQWAVSNGILYDLCRKHPRHDDARVITAKVLLIGRVYAAAIERGRADASSMSGDRFYGEVVPRALMESELDERLGALRRYREIDDDTTKPILETHHYLTERFRKITKKEKRSLASKYLHFHLPELFFLYDSRAAMATRLLLRSWRPPGVEQRMVDRTYARFFHSALELRRRLEDGGRQRLSPRHLDRVLLATHARAS